MKPLSRQGSQIGFARQGAAQAADGMFDPALLPRGVRVTEEGLDAEGLEVVMAGELGAIVEGDGLAAVGGQGPSDRGGGLAGGARERRCGIKTVGLPRLPLAWGR